MRSRVTRCIKATRGALAFIQRILSSSDAPGSTVIHADKMNKLCLVFLGALLFALHLVAQVQAQKNSTVSPTTNVTRNVTRNVTMFNSNMTGNATRDKNAGGRTEVSLLLFPLALGFLYGWF